MEFHNMEYVTEKIIRYVLSQNEFKTAKQIAANINVSESSVKHNIAEAKRFFQKSVANYYQFRVRALFLRVVHSI